MTPQTLHTRRLWALPAMLAALSASAYAQTTATPATAAPTEDSEKAPVKLEEVRVLGSRIRLTETEGPSPVDVYEREYIRATGAFSLADFLNTIPQNYTGISSGRGSAPNELNPEFGNRTETTTPAFNLVTGAASAPRTSSGQSGVSLRGLGSGSTLVLVDGRRVAQSSIGNASTDSRQGFVDLNTIPLGMVERVEVITDGASAIYGADAVAGVVNVVLKKNWVGNELSLSYKGAFDGGGHERSAILTSGFSKNKLRGTVTLEYSDRADLKGDQRPFSREQNHTGIVEGVDANGNPVTGTDLRLNWGYPPTVQARTGNLNGFFRPGTTTPTNVALAPAGFATTPPLAAFTGVGPVPPNTNVFATQQRRGNTSEFLDLISPTERQAVATNLYYGLNSRVELYGGFTFSDIQGSAATQPAVSTASATSGFGNFATIVPAAFNPFGQDVLVGMIHYEFGSVVTRTHTKAYSVFGGARGTAGSTWQWDLSTSWQQQYFDRVIRDFNGAAVSAPLLSGALNPFTDIRAGGPSHAAIYETMARYVRSDGVSEMTSAEFAADGDLFPFRGSAVRMATGASFYLDENFNRSLTPSIAVNPVNTLTTAEGRRESYAAFAEVSVPFFSRDNALPLFRRLDVHVAGRYEDRDDAGTTFVPKYGFSWVPVNSLLLRASYSEGFRAPALTEYQVAASSFNSTLLDPRRGNVSTPNVVTLRGSNPNIKPETSTTEFYGVIYEPPFAKGLAFSANYYRTTQRDVIQSISAQTIVNNEAAFPERIVRAAPTPADTAAGQPGALVSVDQSFANFGKVVNHSLDLGVKYDLPRTRYGHWTARFNASHTLKTLREVRPGLPAVDDGGDTFGPPDWRMSGAVFWSGGGWNVNVFATYLSSFKTNLAGNTLAPLGIPSQMKFDVRGGYTFNEGVWREYAKGLRVQVGIGNVLDEEPPFSDTVFGFNGALHSPLGRTYELSMTLPF
jgi:iron complex outermembrane recepter protein